MRERERASRRQQGAPADSVLAADLARADSITRLGYLDGMMSVVTADVVYLRGGQPMVFGKENVRRLFEAKLPAAGSTVLWQPVRAGVSKDGRAAYTAGVAASSEPADSGRPALRIDRYIAFWRRGAEGHWRVAAYSEVGAPLVQAPPISVGSRPVRSSGTRPQDSVVAVLVRTDSAFSALSARAGLSVAFGDYAASEAMIFNGPEIVVGPAAIRRNYAGPSRGTLTWHAVAGEVAASLDLGFTVGEYALAPRPAVGPGRRGKYLTVWGVQPDGRWKYLTDGGNSAPVP